MCARIRHVPKIGPTRDGTCLETSVAAPRQALSVPPKAMCASMQKGQVPGGLFGSFIRGHRAPVKSLGLIYLGPS